MGEFANIVCSSSLYLLFFTLDVTYKTCCITIHVLKETVLVLHVSRILINSFLRSNVYLISYIFNNIILLILYEKLEYIQLKFFIFVQNLIYNVLKINVLFYFKRFFLIELCTLANVLAISNDFKGFERIRKLIFIEMLSFHCFLKDFFQSR